MEFKLEMEMGLDWETAGGEVVGSGSCVGTSGLEMDGVVRDWVVLCWGGWLPGEMGGAGRCCGTGRERGRGSGSGSGSGRGSGSGNGSEWT